MDKFVVTREWISANATPAGGFKYEQLRILGVQIPPVYGWPARAEGTTITFEQKAKFEAFHLGLQASKKSKAIMARDDFEADGGCNVDELSTDDDELAHSERQKEFEVWAKRHVFSVKKDKQVVYEGAFIYANPMTQGAYMAWCAAKDGS